MKFYFVLALFLVACTGKGQLRFVSAAPYPVEVSQPDGTKLSILGMGDEFNHIQVTKDGYTVMKSPDGYYEFAVKNKTGRLDLSGVRAKNPEVRTVSEKNFLNNSPKYLKETGSKMYNKHSITQSESQLAFPSSGSQRMLLLLIKYPDLDNSYTPSDFNNLMNQTNYSGNGSFRDYYLQASDGKLSMSIDVFGWYVAQHNYDYYGDVNGDERSQELVAEAVDAAEAAGIDFSVYDNDHNGIVDNIMVAHSGPGAEEGSKTEFVWSHSWALGSFTRNYDGVTISPYIIQPETRSYGMVGIGVFCHEFGHALGMPDLYDTNDSNGDSEGLGNWCLMASGSWLNHEKTPAMMSAWVRAKLGWISPAEISAAGDYTLSPASTGTQCYQIKTPNSNEYFLLENRYKTGFDASLPGSGLAIFHVNTNKYNNDDENNKVTDLEEADGKNQLDKNTNRGDAGDVFPGSSNNTAFNDLSNPDAKTYDAKITGIDIQQIQLNGSTIQFTLGTGVETGSDLTYNSATNALQVNGTQVDASMQVKNTGNQNAGAFKVGFYLSTDATISTSDYLIGSKYLSGLNAGSSSSVHFSTDVSTVVPTVPSGTYYVGYIIDYQNSVSELDENNNVFKYASPQVENIPLSNLTYNSSQDNLAVNGSNVTISIKVENNGELTSDACKISYFISTRKPVTTSSYLIGEDNLAALNPGASASKSFSVDVLKQIPNLPQGTYYVGYIIDYQNNVQEKNEMDNSYTFSSPSIEYILKPNLTFIPENNDLQITSTKLNVTLEIDNNGETTSGTGRVGIYLSTNETISSSDYLIATKFFGELNVAQSNIIPVSVDITSLEGQLPEGSYYVGYVIDYNHQITELDENDNDYVFTGEVFHYCPPNVTVFNREICDGDTVMFRNEIYDKQGEYEFTYQSQTGCDSVVVLDLNVKPVNHTDLNETICSGESVTVGQHVYKYTGIYTETLTNQFGCDSVVTLNLQVMEPIEVVLNQTLCGGDSIEVAGNYYSVTGTYINTLTSQWGCDSTVILNVTAHQHSDTLLTKTICKGDSVWIGEKAFAKAGIYTEKLVNHFGCDSLVTLDLTVNPIQETFLNQTICQGDSVWIGNISYVQSGTFVQTFPNRFGCDSTIVLHLTVNPVNDTLLDVILCEGESIKVGDSEYDKTGVYVENLTNRFGCDSTVTLALTVNPVSDTLLEKTICQGESIMVGTSVYNTSGQFVNVLSNRFGCDSTVYLNLTVNPTQHIELYEDICKGTSYSMGGTEYTESGVFQHTFSNQFGCDSVIILHLNVVPLPVIDLGPNFDMFSSETKILDAGAGYSTYSWNTGENTQIIKINGSGFKGKKNFSVIVTNEYSCSSSDEIEITNYDDNSLSIEKESLLKVFPNPSAGDVKLLLKQVTGIYQVEVFNDFGELVFRQEYNSPGKVFVKKLDLTGLTPAMYTLRVISGDKSMIQRLMIFKQH